MHINYASFDSQMISNIGHTSLISIYNFCTSSVIPEEAAHEYMQIQEPHYVSDLPSLQTVSFNGPLAAELTECLMSD